MEWQTPDQGPQPEAPKPSELLIAGTNIVDKLKAHFGPSLRVVVMLAREENNENVDIQVVTNGPRLSLRGLLEYGSELVREKKKIST